MNVKNLPKRALSKPPDLNLGSDHPDFDRQKSSMVGECIGHSRIFGLYK